VILSTSHPHTGPYVPTFGHIRPYCATFGHTKSYLIILGHYATQEYTGPSLPIFGHTWLHLIILDHAELYWTNSLIFGQTCPYLTILGHTRPCTTYANNRTFVREIHMAFVYEREADIYIKTISRLPIRVYIYEWARVIPFFSAERNILLRAPQDTASI